MGAAWRCRPRWCSRAAHIVFNDETLSYVSQTYWYFQEETNESATAPPQVAQGWLVLSGYASQRTNDLEGVGGQTYGPDESSPQSRDFDVAALYFTSPVAGGGYGGYLPSDASPNPWLSGNSLKMVVGYPVDGSLFGASIMPGVMYQTQPQPYAMNPDTVEPEVYTAPWVLSYPGNSGGPVYVEFNGYYYPAGVYLGIINNGSYESAVRAIDSDVVNLITNAEALADYGSNHTGGGVITIIPSQAVSASNPGYLQFLLGPPAAVLAGAGWKLQGDTSLFKCDQLHSGGVVNQLFYGALQTDQRLERAAQPAGERGARRDHHHHQRALYGQQSGAGRQPSGHRHHGNDRDGLSN
jgi:hypothetical protein